MKTKDLRLFVFPISRRKTPAFAEHLPMPYPKTLFTIAQMKVSAMLQAFAMPMLQSLSSAFRRLSPGL
jgi:hypothetical protein